MATEGVSGCDGLEDLIGAINFAALKHTKQRRKDAEKTPYINHPIGVMNILCNEGENGFLNFRLGNAWDWFACGRSHVFLCV